MIFTGFVVVLYVTGSLNCSEARSVNFAAVVVFVIVADFYFVADYFALVLIAFD